MSAGASSGLAGWEAVSESCCDPMVPLTGVEQNRLDWKSQSDFKPMKLLAKYEAGAFPVWPGML
jgi:hypothetical protein